MNTLADYYTGRSIIFRPGTSVAGLVANVVKYTYSTGTSRGVFTVARLPSAPPVGATFDVIGEPAATVRTKDDSTNGWILPKVWRESVTANYIVRAYAPAATTLNLYGGGGSLATHSLAAGWNTKMGTLIGGDKMVGRTIYISATAGETVYVTWVRLDQNGSPYSGVYTPTLTSVANISTPYPYECQYNRVGDVVTVGGRADIAVTSGSVATPVVTKLGIQLPIASNFGAVEDCAGPAFNLNSQGQGAAIFADTANDRAQLEFYATSTGTYAMHFTFIYQIL